MSLMLVVLVIAFIVIVDAVVVAAVFRRVRGRAAAAGAHWQWLAQRLGVPLLGGDPLLPRIAWLSFLRRPFRIEGPFHGHSLLVHHYAVSHGDSSTTYTAVRISGPNPRGLSLHIGRETALTRIGQALGLRDIQTGDPRFDRLLFLKSNDPDFVRGALLPELRARIVDIWERQRASGAITLNGNELQYAEVGMIRDEATRERIAAMADLLATLRGVVMFYNR